MRTFETTLTTINLATGKKQRAVNNQKTVMKASTTLPRP
jgi:hypothetical protein